MFLKCYTTYVAVAIIFILLSLAPTPMLIHIYFKPDRKRVKHILCGVCMKKTGVSEKNIYLAITGSTEDAHSANADMYM